MKTRFDMGMALAAALVLAAPAAELAAQAGPDGEAAVHSSARHNFRVDTVVAGLEQPWSVAWLPNGDMLVTEKPGRLRIVRDGVLDPQPIAGTPEVRARGQGGLLEVLPHPDFAQNRWLYLTYSKPNTDASLATTALMRARLEGQELVDAEELFVADAWGASNAHFAGRLAWDDEGHLFMSVGDRGEDPDLLEDQPAQDPSNHIGTILRFNDDGTVPDDNPFVGRSGHRPEIWSYGHRNPQGLAIHPETGEVWLNEHGPRGGDEINVARPGRNYGWPVVSYGVNYDGTIFTEDVGAPDMVSPRHVWVPSIATSGMMIYDGERFPWWEGSVFVGGLGGQMLARMTFEGDRAVGEERLLEGELGRIRDVRQGPDGYIYLAVDARGGPLTPIVRLVPAEDEVETPTSD